MACVDVLSDDDDEPAAHAPQAAADPLSAPATPAEVVPVVAAVASAIPATATPALAAGAGSVDILSDDEDVDESVVPEPQPSRETVLNLPAAAEASQAAQCPAASSPSGGASTSQLQVGAGAPTLPPTKGLRTAAEADVDVADSEDECIQPPQPSHVVKLASASVKPPAATLHGGATSSTSTSGTLVKISGVPLSMSEKNLSDLLQQFGGPLQSLQLPGGAEAHQGHGVAEFVDSNAAIVCESFSPLLGYINVEFAESARTPPQPQASRTAIFWTKSSHQVKKSSDSMPKCQPASSPHVPCAAGVRDDDDNEDLSLDSLAAAVEQPSKASAMVSTQVSSLPGAASSPLPTTEVRKAKQAGDEPAAEPPAKKAKGSITKAPKANQADNEPAAEPPAKKSKGITPEGPAGDVAPSASAKKVTPSKDAKDVKEKKLTKDEMENRVLEYMQQQNRPYNAQNVFDNLHGAVPKGQVQLLLDALALNGKLAVKEYGKAKVYLPSQVGTSDRVEEEAQSLQNDIDATKANVEASKASLEESRRLLSSLRRLHSIAAEAKASTDEVPQLEGRLSTLRAAAETTGSKEDADVDEAELSRVEAECRSAHREWRRRKRLCMEILHLFSEMSGTKVPALAEKYCVDTDEACSQIFPEVFSQ